MKTRIPQVFFFFIPLLFFIINLNAQNLVPNPNFEDYSSCPTGEGQIDVLDDWYSPTAGTPDFFHGCFGPGIGGVGVPINFMGNQLALSGKGYAGFLAHVMSGG